MVQPAGTGISIGTDRIKRNRATNNAVLTINGDSEDNFDQFEFKIKEFNIPKDGIDTIKVPNPFNANYKVYGSTRSQEPLVVPFIVDEELDNYWSLKEWLNKIKSKNELYAGEYNKDLNIAVFDNRNNYLYTLVYTFGKLVDLSGFKVIPGADINVVVCEASFEFLVCYRIKAGVRE